VARGDATRSRILHATVNTLAQEGYAGTTARAIAAKGGFAPGVIYYHFKDLDDLFLATMRFTSEGRLERYRRGTEGITNAVDLLERLRSLYFEDADIGHIAAVQELMTAPSQPMAERTREEVRRWQSFAEDVITNLVADTPFAAFVPVHQAAEAAVAFYLGMEMLMHLDGDRTRPDSFFGVAQHAAVMIDNYRHSQTI
jgi:AcrR family transcriptional regulator